MKKHVGRWMVDLSEGGWPSWFSIKDIKTGEEFSTLSHEEIRDLRYALKRVLVADGGKIR